MNKLVFATNNSNKIKEIKSLLNKKFNILSLDDINCFNEIPETGKTIKENALLKAKYVFDTFNYNCFADDTGLEVEVLNNSPGVYSARYAGEEKNANKNVNKILAELENISNRKALFRTVICLIINGNVFFFEGIVNGQISKKITGKGGFGYDPIFIPDGFESSFAEMSLEEKNKISHRGIATQKMMEFLNNNYK